MKNLVIMLAVGAFFLGLAVTVLPVNASPAFEDPQVCLGREGDPDLELLRVDPTTAPIDVWLRVGPKVVVDYNVVNCGGDPTLPTVDPSQVSVGGDKYQVKVKVLTEPKAKVVFTFGDKSKTVKADKKGWVEVEGKLK